MRGPGVMAAIGRLLAADAARAGTQVAIHEGRANPWHSATFDGERVSLRINAPATSVTAAWLAELPAIDGRLPGHLLAELTVTDREESDGRYQARIDALTVAVA